MICESSLRFKVLQTDHNIISTYTMSSIKHGQSCNHGNIYTSFWNNASTSSSSRNPSPLISVELNKYFGLQFVKPTTICA